LRVLDSVVQCLEDRTFIANVDSYREGFRGVGQSIRVLEGTDLERSAPEIIEDLIYGGLLHGDFDRHERVKSRPAMTHNFALWQFTVDAEHYIRQLSGAIRRSIDDGILADLGM
jgi:hypothetical protein